MVATSVVYMSCQMKFWISINELKILIGIDVTITAVLAIGVEVANLLVGDISRCSADESSSQMVGDAD